MYQNFFWVSIIETYHELKAIDKQTFFTTAYNFNILWPSLLGLLLITLTILIPKAKVWPFALALFFVLIQALVQNMHINYFQVMQVPFSDQMIGAGAATYSKEIITSTIHELTPLFYMLLVSSTLIYAATVAGYSYIQKNNQKRKVFIFGGITGTIILITTFSFFRGIQDYKPAELKTAGGLTLSVTLLRQDPVLTLFKIFTADPEPVPAQATPNDAPQKEYTMGYDTRSQFDKKLIGRVNLPRKKYNIILYFFESTAASYIGHKYNGKSVTPVWDKLKKNSFVANRHYVQYPLSVNSMYSVLASSYELPIKDYITTVKPDIKQWSLSEIFKKHGYRTGLIHTGNIKNFAHDRYLQHRQFDIIQDIKDLDHSQYGKMTDWAADDRTMVDAADKFINHPENPATDEPFFLALFPTWPHHPYLVPEDKFRITKKELNTEHRTFQQRRWLSYLNTLHYADFVLGELIENLRKKDQLKNTIIMVFSDHGEAFYQHRQNYLHALFLYQENVHVPFIIYNEELFAEPVEYNYISRHIDIAPTALDLTGLPTPESMEGISLLSSHYPQMAYFHTQWTDDYIGLHDGPWKYILNVQYQNEQLFHIENDPTETKNLAAEKKDLVTRFRNTVLDIRSYKKWYFQQFSIHLR